MRIAISGSHSLGKSTFVRDFLQAHPEYSFEDEPYRALKDKHQILFAEKQRQSDIDLQINYSIQKTKSYLPGANVIFDRCPADYIPYSSYSIDHGNEDITRNYVESLYPKVREALSFLDLIIFIPITEEHPILLEDDGHRPTHDFYREWVDAAFKELYRKNPMTIMPERNAPKLVEIWGDRESRMKKINEYL